jgi:malate dehydrogenase
MLSASSSLTRSVGKSLFNKMSYSSTTAAGKKVAVLGAGGGIGQPLSMLLKLSPAVSELACYDIVGTPGVAADLSHVRVFFTSISLFFELFAHLIVLCDFLLCVT